MWGLTCGMWRKDHDTCTQMVMGTWLGMESCLGLRSLTYAFHGKRIETMRYYEQDWL